MRHLICAMTVCGLMGACTLAPSDNGALDGFWQLCTVDTIGGATADMRENGVYWAIQKDLMEVRHSNEMQVLFRFSHSGDSLAMWDPYMNNRDESDIKVNDVTLLRPLGINRLEEHFRVAELNGSRMVLESPCLRLWFRRY